MVFHRLDRITSIKIADRKATPLRNIPGYEQGVNYQELASGLPYMYTDPKETIRFLADKEIVDQIVDWFGPEVEMRETKDPTKVHVTVRVSPNAMEHWADATYQSCGDPCAGVVPEQNPWGSGNGTCKIQSEHRGKVKADLF